MSPPVPDVRVTIVQPQAAALAIELPARIDPARITEIRAPFDGIVERRLYEEGTVVQAGQPLFQIDRPLLRARIEAIEAEVAHAEAVAASAAQDVARYDELVAEQAISAEEYDAAVASVSAASADVAQARASLDSARLALENSTVIAPVSGRVRNAEVIEGTPVTGAPATLLTRIEQLDPVSVSFARSSPELLAVRRDIAAGELRLERENVKVSLVLEDGSVYPHAGRLSLDSRDGEATGSDAPRIEVPDPEGLLTPGQRVQARVEGAVRPRAFLLRRRAVRGTQQDATVLVVGANQVAQRRAVTVAEPSGDSWVVLSGLAPNERVISEGLEHVQPGDEVHVVAYEGPYVAGRAIEVEPAPR